MSEEIAELDDLWAAARAAAKAGDPATANDYYGRLVPLLPAADQVAALLDWGAAQQQAGQWGEAEAHYRQALALTEQGTDRAAQAHSGAVLARLLESTGAFDQALTILAAARDDFAALGDEGNLQQVLGRMARAYTSQGDYTAALAASGQKLEIATRLHLPREVGQARYQMGTIYTAQGAYDQALACFEESLEQATAAGNRADAALAKDQMGLVYTILGRYPAALACYADALETAEALGSRRNVSHIAVHIGQIYLHYGDYARAHACCAYLLQTALALGDRPGTSVALALLADAALHQEQYAEAERLIGAAIALARAMNLGYLPGYLCAAADLALRQGHAAEAQPLVEEALRRAAESGHKAFEFEARLLDLRGRVAQGQMTAEDAHAMLDGLLTTWPGDAEQAILHYEIWRLDPSQTAHRQAALARYQQLYTETPEVDERRRIEELTGAALPDPPPLPDLPAVVVRQPPRLDDLLTQVDVLVAQPE